jgi:hypothetical protein
VLRSFSNGLYVASCRWGLAGLGVILPPLLDEFVFHLIELVLGKVHHAANVGDVVHRGRCDCLDPGVDRGGREGETAGTADPDDPNLFPVNEWDLDAKVVNGSTE